MIINNNAAKLGIILGNFDFVKTQALMEDIGWVWGLGEDEAVPCVAEMVNLAHSILLKASNGHGDCACGGFEATFDKGMYTLKFVVEESSNEDSFVYTPNLETISRGCGYSELDCKEN